MLAGLARLEHKVSILERSIQSTNGGRPHSSGSNSRSQQSLESAIEYESIFRMERWHNFYLHSSSLSCWTPMLSKLMGEKLLSYQVQLIKKFNDRRLTIISHSVLIPETLTRDP
ncbi:hypothetical protein P3S68_003869 [Capsicum galapagoense]